MPSASTYTPLRNGEIEPGPPTSSQVVGLTVVVIKSISGPKSAWLRRRRREASLRGRLHGRRCACDRHGRPPAWKRPPLRLPLGLGLGQLHQPGVALRSLLDLVGLLKCRGKFARVNLLLK